MSKATNNRRVVTAYARVDSAIYHLEFLLSMNKSREKYSDGTMANLGVHTKFAINSALFDLRNAKTMLSHTTFKHKDKYGRKMGDD